GGGAGADHHDEPEPAVHEGPAPGRHGLSRQHPRRARGAAAPQEGGRAPRAAPPGDGDATRGAMTEATASAERSVLIVGDDLGRVDRFVSPLLRANYSVRRMLAAPTALKLIRRSPFD